jgi:(2Fe-2S) ferredoxin
MAAITRHVFVCVNQRPVGGKPSCGARGSAEIFEAFQRELGARPDTWGCMAVTSCGCLGPCFEGPAVVVYPDAVWYVGLKAEDVGEIVEEHLVAGVPVERLRYRWPE